MLLQIASKNKSFPLHNSPGVGEDSERISKIREKSRQELNRHNDFDFVKRIQDSARSLEERLYDARALCKIKTSEVAMHLDNEWRKRFFRQLDNLMDIDNWEEDDAPVEIASFITLLRMLTLIKPTRRPGLGSTSGGNIIAAWTIEMDRLTIECLAEDRVRWVLSRIADGVRESGAGDVPLIRLPAVLSPYDPDCWFFNDA